MQPAEHAAGRLKQLRLREGLTQSKFAEKLEVSQYKISRMEHGEDTVPAEVMAKATRLFNLPAEYFSRPPHSYERNSLNFRRTKMTMKAQDRVIAHFAELEEMVQRTTLNIPQADLSMERPRSAEPLSLGAVELVANKVRALLNLGTGPVRNVTRAMESAGVVVAPLQIEGLPLDEFDGISSPSSSPRVRVTAYAPSSSGDRHRFTLAHELGHLVMHTLWRPESESVREKEAHMFAGAFLLPRSLIDGVVNEGTTLKQFAEVKSETGVSIQAIVRRARDLALISPDRYTSLLIQISGRGWRKKEPVEVQLEKEVLFSRILEEYKARNVVSIFNRSQG
ncbi:XRE family transcriptional regulator [Corynebacterium cystitidis]|nr:XRE family transcriptional regulator [Corynebacterium cystitidis]